MAQEVSSAQELYNIFKDEVEAYDGDFTDFEEGSMLDILAGASSIAGNELSELIISEFKKTYFETAHGPEVTGSVDDLQNLAVDHFGDRFKRPEANKATGSVTFSRPNTDEGNVTISAGTVVKTEKDSQGQEIFFETTEEVVLTGLSVDAQIIAQVAGSDGNVDPNKIIVIETALTDSSIVVTNSQKLAGGDDAQDDAEYRETIRNLIQSLAGATKSAIEGIILGVSGVSILTLIEEERIVIDYDIANSQPLAGASYFRIPYPKAYIADENGQSSQALIDEVLEALESVRACGVKIEVAGAVPINLSWDASFILDAGGPNFSELQSSFVKITDSMNDYLKALDIGESFNKQLANEYILSIWGPDGTGDLVSFNTNSPVANVSVNENEKILPNVMSINGVQP